MSLVGACMWGVWKSGVRSRLSREDGIIQALAMWVSCLSCYYDKMPDESNSRKKGSWFQEISSVMAVRHGNGNMRQWSQLHPLLGSKGVSSLR